MNQGLNQEVLKLGKDLRAASPPAPHILHRRDPLAGETLLPLKPKILSPLLFGFFQAAPEAGAVRRQV